MIFLVSIYSHAQEGGQGHGQGETEDYEDSVEKGEVGGEPLLVCWEADNDVAVD